VQSPSTSLRTGTTSKLSRQRERFLQGLLGPARRVAARYGLPVSVMLAQAALESNWGRSRLARVARNLFGIKAVSRHAEAVTLPTCEYNGRRRASPKNAGGRMLAARFAAYASVEDCLGDYARLLAFAPRYAAARAVADDPFAFAEQLAACGYATDPGYGKKICALMRRYELTRFDSERVQSTSSGLEAGGNK